MGYCFLRFPEGKLKAVTLSYDDGDLSDLRLARLLEQHGMKGTFNVCSGTFDREGRMKPQELREEILGRGHEVAVHGERHLAPGAAESTATAIADVLNCRRDLEAHLGGIIRGMAYPDSGITKMHNGNDYATIRAYLQDLGISYARTLAGDNDAFMLPTDFYAWMPTAHHINPSLDEYVEKFLAIREEELRGASLYPRLFYLWGHTFEFEREGNWDLIERFCERMAGHGDTWYATNGEICDYVEAYSRLLWSVDRKTVYNPTLYDIWMNVDKKTLCVRSGETLVLERK